MDINQNYMDIYNGSKGDIHQSIYLKPQLEFHNSKQHGSIM